MTTDTLTLTRTTRRMAVQMQAEKHSGLAVGQRVTILGGGHAGERARITHASLDPFDGTPRFVLALDTGMTQWWYTGRNLRVEL